MGALPHPHRGGGKQLHERAILGRECLDQAAVKRREAAAQSGGVRRHPVSVNGVVIHSPSTAPNHSWAR